MRTPLIAGNWKMNTDGNGAAELAGGIASRAGEVPDVELLVCPPAIYLTRVRNAIGDASVGLGAQNMSCQPSGAFTGEISAGMLTDIGAQYVILGHSERRHIFGESDENVNKKTHAALAAGLVPVVCVGELLEEREAGRTAEVISGQIKGSLAGITAEQISTVVIAYEPVWAIGTGKVATPEQAEEVHADLRKQLAECYNAEVAETVRILYGGSVKPDNANDLLGQPNIDGALIGGASLKVDDFLAIAAAGAAVAQA
ncbi:MAG: triose-phosphate isomerase [Planctomycetes bacterium]|nr:triose-phosphate isomerase [Planctomycetota bacterium]